MKLLAVFLAIKGLAVAIPFEGSLTLTSADPLPTNPPSVTENPPQQPASSSTELKNFIPTVTPPNTNPNIGGSVGNRVPPPIRAPNNNRNPPADTAPAPVIDQNGQKASPTQVIPSTQSDAAVIDGISQPDSVAAIQSNGNTELNGQLTPSGGDSTTADDSNQNSSSKNNWIFVPIAAAGVLLVVGFTAKFLYYRNTDSKSPSSQLPDIVSTSEGRKDQVQPGKFPRDQPKDFSFPTPPPALPPVERLSVAPISALFAAHGVGTTDRNVKPNGTANDLENPNSPDVKGGVNYWDPMPVTFSSGSQPNITPNSSPWSKNLNAHSSIKKEFRPSLKNAVRITKRELRPTTDAATIQKHRLVGGKVQSSAKSPVRKHRAQPQFPARKTSTETKIPSPLSR
jgi:hypothetical protein